MFFRKKKAPKMIKNMVDMHCHILPGVDDGAGSPEEALQMLKIAEKEGITHMICTPHYKNHRKSVAGEALSEAFHNFQKMAAEHGCKIQLYLGNEVFYFRELEQAVDDGLVHEMNESSHMLIEFHPQETFRAMQHSLYDVSSLGYVPILAHAERYECLYHDILRVEELHKAGTKIQVNAKSVTGEHGFGVKRFVERLLKEQMVDYVSTDAHNTEKRAPKFRKCRNFLYRKYDSQYVNEILFENAKRDFLE